MVIAYVTDKNDREHPHHCLNDGILFPANGTVVLICERNENGHIKEGHVYAPGQWREVNIQTDE